MPHLELETLRHLVDTQEVDTVVTAFPDMFGRLMGKRITGRFFLEEVIPGGMHACDYLLACDMEMDPVPGYQLTSWERGYGDLHAVVDLTSLRLLPWVEKTAFVLCDVFHGNSHQAIEVAPRTILKRQLERAAALGVRPMMGSELEFYAFQHSYEEAKRRGFHRLEPCGWYIEDYHILQGTKLEPFLRAVRNAMEAAGVSVEFSKGEWGPGQHEINLCYADALEMADRHVLYKSGIKEMAAQHELAVTFMAKWNTKYAGSSCHIHTSLWDAAQQTNRFVDTEGSHGRSALFGHFLAGSLEHASALMMFYAPYVNSYKRYQAGSFAPTRLAWSEDNRTVGFRVLGRGNGLRVENRIPGADANPYLAFAAMIAAGLDGIERALEPPPVFTGDAYAATDLPQVPTRLEEAIEACAASEFVREALGETVVEHYLHAARTEVNRSAQAVTCWERERYFERG